MWKVGDIIDFLDKTDVYCPAVIKGVENGTVVISYIGWGSEWDESVTDMARISTRQTIKAKAWVRLSPKICFWPSVIYIRRPKIGSDVGRNYLKAERRIYMVPCGSSKPPLKPYKHGVWIAVSNMTPISRKYEERYQEGQQSQHKEHFLEAFEELMNDDESLNLDFKFEGSFEIREELEAKANQVKAAKQLLKDERAAMKAAKRQREGGAHGASDPVLGDQNCDGNDSLEWTSKDECASVKFENLDPFQKQVLDTLITSSRPPPLGMRSIVSILEKLDFEVVPPPAKKFVTSFPERERVGIGLGVASVYEVANLASDVLDLSDVHPIPIHHPHHSLWKPIVPNRSASASIPSLSHDKHNGHNGHNGASSGLATAMGMMIGLSGPASFEGSGSGSANGEQTKEKYVGESSRQSRKGKSPRRVFLGGGVDHAHTLETV